MMDAEPAPEEFVADVPPAAFVAPPAETPRQEAATMEVSRPHEIPSVPENADMQAKPAPVSRSAASELVDERRPEPRAEPRFLPSARPTEPAHMSTPAPAADAAPQRLVSGSTTTAVSTAFGTLARTVASNSRTVDDLVTEAIRPMLKEWLDENLPALVERLVRAEIERVSRQGQ
ncbi:DUF2497 domain-containing protein [Ancylobacter sp. VKM B-3255]|uniref:DUF2497 domain-containing protein n=2 Tax=Ancylobacter radicis TaxID=2836179 RepID=A0ABS5R3E3_9HYPH|nr:DUF2497 domain-containing protein [Ancylobacter radicis]